MALLGKSAVGAGRNQVPAFKHRDTASADCNENARRGGWGGSRSHAVLDLFRLRGLGSRLKLTWGRRLAGGRGLGVRQRLQGVVERLTPEARGKVGCARPGPVGGRPETGAP